ncbi:MAG: hypothetical protein EU531_02540 [Promethearchaeota archaeon]|nr:MAG: hypothetical protein EU531_02540 [Candidatus Lokiarchaeota archaeon]
MDEVFYEVKESKNLSEIKNEEQCEIILHFLAKADQNTILYETKQIISKSPNISIDTAVIDLLQGVINQVDNEVSLVKGKIREIFLSYSS